MIRPIHETLRAAGQGLLAGSAVAVPLCAAVVYLGPVALAVAGPVTGITLITVANALQRRAQYKAKAWK